MPFYLAVPALLAESQQIISHGWPGLVSMHLEVCPFQFPYGLLPNFCVIMTIHYLMLIYNFVHLYGTTWSKDETQIRPAAFLFLLRTSWGTFEENVFITLVLTK